MSNNKLCSRSIIDVFNTIKLTLKIVEVMIAKKTTAYEVRKNNLNT